MARENIEVKGLLCGSKIEKIMKSRLPLKIPSEGQNIVPGLGEQQELNKKVNSWQNVNFSFAKTSFSSDQFLLFPQPGLVNLENGKIRH